MSPQCASSSWIRSRYCMGPSLGIVDASKTNASAGYRHPRQKFEGTGLVEELVQVPALRALNARGAAAFAGTAGEELGGIGYPALELVEATGRDADPAGVAVVDEDRRRAGVEVEVGREAADVPAVAHRPQRQERDQRVLGRVEGREEQRHRLEALELVRPRHEPDGLGVERRWRQVERDSVEGRPVRGRLLLVRDYLLGHRHPAERELEPEPPLDAQRLLDRR